MSCSKLRVLLQQKFISPAPVCVCIYMSCSRGVYIPALVYNDFSLVDPRRFTTPLWCGKSSMRPRARARRHRATKTQNYASRTFVTPSVYIRKVFRAFFFWRAFVRNHTEKGWICIYADCARGSAVKIFWAL